MTIKLGKIDRRLLSYIYHNYREPLTKIAKACKISRDQVEYRLDKYEREGLIKKYVVIFNYSALGYNEFTIVWFRLRNNKQAVKKQLETLKNVVSVGEVLPNYDLYANFICKDKTEFEQVLSKFLKENDENIQSYEILIATYTEFFPLKIFGNLKAESYIAVKRSEPDRISEKDLKFLRIIEENGRRKIVEIANKSKLSAELALYKIRNLYKKKVILGNRVQFDMENLGFYFAVVRIKLKSLTDSTKEKLLTFSKSHRNINALVFGISDYNCMIQLFYQTDNELRKTVQDIRTRLKEDIIKEDLLLIENESRAKTLPY